MKNSSHNPLATTDAENMTICGRSIEIMDLTIICLLSLVPKSSLITFGRLIFLESGDV